MKRFLKMAGGAAMILAGILMIISPIFFEYLFEHKKYSRIETFDQSAEAYREDELEEIMAAAKAYNESLLQEKVQVYDPFSGQSIQSEGEHYKELLNIDDSGMMGLIRIPDIGARLPIYHTAKAEVLEKGVGHLEGTSLPVGGENTHCVLTGHTGFGTAEIFTNLTELQEGDVFFLDIMGRSLAYEVDQICVVEPTELDGLQIVPGEDLCTLVTCTPYGINTHRLLVRGHRTVVPEEEAIKEVRKKASWREQYQRDLLIVALLIVAGLTVVWLLNGRKKRRYEKKD